MFLFRRAPSAPQKRTTSLTSPQDDLLPSPKRRRANTTTATPSSPLSGKENVTFPPKRWNPAIDPSTPAFITVLTRFTHLLQDPLNTVEDLVTAHFTPHERDMLLAPSSTDAAALGNNGNGNTQLLNAMRASNAARYADLLQTARFKGCDEKGGPARENPVAFKLAMAWFGLPVAPLRGVPGVFAGGEDGDGDGDGDGSGEIGEGGDRLRFLDGYRERAFGRDVGVRVPDPELEVFYEKGAPLEVYDDDAWHAAGNVQLGVRGGESGSGRDVIDLPGPRVEEIEDEMSDVESGQLALRGGTSEGAKTRAEKLYTPLGGPSSDTEEHWVPLYGYQGVVWFRLDLLYTFVDAVDRLLGLDNRAGVSYNLYLMDKSKSYATEAEREQFLSEPQRNGLSMWADGPGNYSNDRLAWEWVLDQLGAWGQGDEDNQQVIFIAGPADPVPWRWEPEPEDHVLKLTLEWADAPAMNRPDVAYLRMPQNPRDAVYANQFGPWMARACRVLAAGRISGRPGYPAIPDAWITVQGHGRKHTTVGSYGGLGFLPRLWGSIVTHWESGVSTVTLEARTASSRGKGDANISDRWHFFLPGLAGPYEEQYILHNDVDDVEIVRQRIFNVVERSMTQDDFASLKSLEVHLPGTSFFIVSNKPPEVVIDMRAMDRNAAFQPLVDRLVHWRSFLQAKPGVAPVTDGLGMFPQFITLRPVFDVYTLCDIKQIAEATVWDPKTSSLAHFRGLVNRLWAAGGAEPTRDARRSWIVISQGRLAGGATQVKKQDMLSGKPQFVVNPDTTETEWFAIRSLLVEPDVVVSLTKRSALPQFGNLITEQPFGYRDIYETPTSLLYRTLASDQIPASGRHFDWQLWSNDVHPQLKTVQPWENQPQSLSSFYDYTNFPLQPPPVANVPPTVGHLRGAGARSRTRRAARRNRREREPQPLSPSPPNRVRFQTVTDVERGHRLREYSYAHPLDVHMHNAVPINAPPLDSLLTTGHDSLPSLSLSVLTPTEVRRLQQSHYNMRNLLLSRTVACPYASCTAVYPANQPLALQWHLESTHVAEKCNFCDEKLYAHWSVAQRYRHLVKKHAGILGALETPLGDYGAGREIRDEKRTDNERESKYKFCPRCGRDHGVLDVPADRAQHDNVCYPGAGDEGPDWSACKYCGDEIPEGGEGHEHGERYRGGEGAPYCVKCGLPKGLFSDQYGVKHDSFCKGHGRDDAKYCPWCGVQLDLDFDARAKHIEECASRPDPDAEGPIDMEKREYHGTRRRRIAAASSSRKNHPVVRQSSNKAKAPSQPSNVATTSGERQRREPLARRSTGDTVASSAPSTSHSARSAESWRPPSPSAAAAAAAAAAPTGPAAPRQWPLSSTQSAAASTAAAPAVPKTPAKPTSTPKDKGKGKGKAAAKPKTTTTTTTATKPSPARTPAAPPAPSARVTRSAARAARTGPSSSSPSTAAATTPPTTGSKRKRPAPTVEDASESQESPEPQAKRPRADDDADTSTAKSAQLHGQRGRRPKKHVSYASPLEEWQAVAVAGPSSRGRAGGDDDDERRHGGTEAGTGTGTRWRRGSEVQPGLERRAAAVEEERRKRRREARRAGVGAMYGWYDL